MDYHFISSLFYPSKQTKPLSLKLMNSPYLLGPQVCACSLPLFMYLHYWSSFGTALTYLIDKWMLLLRMYQLCVSPLIVLGHQNVHIIQVDGPLSLIT